MTRRFLRLQACTPERQSLCESHRQRRWLTRRSYGFRPRRGQHDALDALAFGITRTNVQWILDADLAEFFESVSHSWLFRLASQEQRAEILR